MIFSTMLLYSTGVDVFETGARIGDARLDMTRVAAAQDSDDGDAFRLAVFHILCCVPIVCACLQLLAWSNFNLRGKRLNWVKSVRAGVRVSLV